MFISFARTDGMPILLNTVWLIYYFLVTASIMYLGNCAKNEVRILYHFLHVLSKIEFLQGKKTAVVIHKAINIERNSNFADRLSKLSLQLVHRPIKFSCELFSFDLVYFHTVSLPRKLQHVLQSALFLT